MLAQTPVDVVMRLHELWNNGSVEFVPEIYSPEFVAHMPRGWSRSEFSGHDGARQLIARIRLAFPDWHERVVDIVANDDRVVTRYISTGTHTGPLDDLPPTMRAIVVDEISIYRIERSRIREQWCLVDDISFARQLGIIPPESGAIRGAVDA